MYRLFLKFRAVKMVLITFGVAVLFGTYSLSFALAHTPDRCFHKHYNNTTKCKSRIRGKKCTDASGNKGKCVQNSSSCYCKIYKKSGNNNKLIDLGLDVGITILKNKKHKKHNKHRNKHHKKH